MCQLFLNRPLGHCNSIALRNGYFKNLVVIDSDGNQFEVESAKKTGTRGPFWGFNLFLEQKIKVSLEFSKSKEMASLGDVKNKIKRWVNQDKYFWESSYGDLQPLFDRIENASSFDELILILN